MPRRTIVALSVLALALAACSAGGGTSTDPGAAPRAAGDAPLALASGVGVGGVGVTDGITVSGVGRVTGAPDVLRVTLGVEARRDSVAAALAAANEASAAVMAALRDAGVADEDIQTRDLSVYPRYDEGPALESGEPRISGYVVTNLVDVRIRDVDGAGDTLDEVVRAAGDDARVHGIGFELEDNAALLDGARERAFADARAKAERYAELAGVELGSLVALSEQASPLPRPVDGAEMMAADAAAESIPIAAGQQEVVVTVTTVWSIG